MFSGIQKDLGEVFILILVKNSKQRLSFFYTNSTFPIIIGNVVYAFDQSKYMSWIISYDPWSNNPNVLPTQIYNHNSIQVILKRNYIKNNTKIMTSKIKLSAILVAE